MTLRNRWTAGLVAGAVLGAAAVAVTSGTGTADAASGFTVTAEQLQINQRISQAAVKRSNQSLNYLAPIRTSQTDSADDGTNGVTPLSQITGAGKGWTTGQIADGAITRTKMADGLLAYWAVVDNQGARVRSQPSSVTTTRLGPGRYEVTFPTAVDQCAYQVSIASPDGQPPTPLNNGAISVFAPSSNTLQVRTYTLQVSPPTDQDRPFHVTVNC